MEWLRDIDWLLFVAVTTAAATIATAFSTSWVLWLRRRERPEPDWVVLGHVSRPSKHQVERHASDPSPSMGGRLHNAGDGVAFRVTVEGRGCRVEFVKEGDDSRQGFIRMAAALPMIALFEQGESARIRITCAADDWEEAEVVVTWTRPPTRLGKRRSTRMRLREIAPLPAEESS